MTRSIQTERAPAALGPYSQGVISGELLFTAGQIPLDPATGKLVGGDFAMRVRQVLQNLDAVCQAAGTSLNRAVKLTVFLTDLSHFATVNAVFSEMLTEPYPARSAVQVAALPLGTDIEIECIAELPRGE